MRFPPCLAQKRPDHDAAGDRPSSRQRSRPPQLHGPATPEPWVADMTFLPTLAGFLYLAVVLDAWSRRIVDGPSQPI